MPITLGIPSEAPERLRNLFENQIVTLNNIRSTDMQEEMENDLVFSLYLPIYHS